MKKYLEYIFKALFFPVALVVAIITVTANLVKNKSLRIMNAKLRAIENVEFVHRDKDGNIKQLFKWNFIGRIFSRIGMDLRNFFTGSYVDKISYSNLITNAGFAGGAAILGAIGTPAPYVYIALGTGTTAANVTDTTLETETSATGMARAIGTSITQTTVNVTDDTLTVTKTFTNTSGGTVTVTEAGLLNAASVGVLYARRVFSGAAIDNTDSFQGTWNVTNA